MAQHNQDERWRCADEEVRKNLPPGVTLLRTLRGHTNGVCRITWSADGQLLASPSEDKTIRLWDTETGECLRTLNNHQNVVISAAFDPAGLTLASGSDDGTIKLWKTASGDVLKTVGEDMESVLGLSWSKDGHWLASASTDGTVRLWDAVSWTASPLISDGEMMVSVAWASDSTRLAGASSEARIWEAATGKPIHRLGRLDNFNDVAWSTDAHSQWLATATMANTVLIWEAATGKQVRVLEGHTSPVMSVSFAGDGRLLASDGEDHTIRLWSCDDWREVASIRRPPLQPQRNRRHFTRATFHPHLPRLATVGSDPRGPEDERNCVIHILELDLAVLLKRRAAPTISYTSAKIVLVGESGVGKSGLGWRLAHGEFKADASTERDQFWLLKQLSKQRRDGTQCEAVLWDLAGQPDYRLIHALFLDDADLALVLFDATRNDDPLAGVEFWLKQLKVGTPAAEKIPTLLIAARSDRGTPRLTKEELEAYCKQRGIAAYLPTSAFGGDGIEELFERMQELIPWDDKPATVTTKTFKRIKDFVLKLKENLRPRNLLLTHDELRTRLEKKHRGWKFSDDEMLTAIRHLANHGYVTLLKTSRGEPRVLLTPELLNNLAKSFVLETRRNQKGLGSLEEHALLTGGYKFPQLEKLSETDRGILMDSAAVLFLNHNVCFRETDLQARAYLVFPELINLKRPLEDDSKPVVEGVAYTVSGAVENVYASLVVLMGYTQTFTRTNQWRNHARYEVGNGEVCGFRLEEERSSELDFVLYFGDDTDAPVRMLFQALFEKFLARRNLTVRRFEPVACPRGHLLNRAVFRQRISTGAGFTFCAECGRKITLPKADQPIQLSRQQAEEVQANDREAERRSRFELVLYRLKTYATKQKSPAPGCFISYAWGNPEHERWVEKSLATDLQKAGISVVLDRWQISQLAGSTARFVEQIAEIDRIIVVGTPLYRIKYDNRESMGGFVVAAEGDMIGARMIGTEAQKSSVLPVLLEGTKELAFPPLLGVRGFADFRNREAYFDKAIEVLLNLYKIGPQHPFAVDVRESLGGGKT